MKRFLFSLLILALAGILVGQTTDAQRSTRLQSNQKEQLEHSVSHFGSVPGAVRTPTRSDIFFESFEGTNFPPTGWTVNDADGDGFNWFRYAPAGGAHSGNAVAASESYYNDWGLELEPDNWLITPAITIPAGGAMLEYYVAAQDPDWPNETYSCLISTTTNAISSFTTVLDTQTFTNGNWNEKTINLAAYAGETIYLAFRHHDCTDNFILKVDDVRVYITVDYDLAAQSVTGPSALTVNTEGTFTVSVQNNGTEDASGYLVKLMAGDEEIDSTFGPTIEAGETETFEFAWIPDTAGPYTLTGVIEWGADENPNNNVTAPHNVTVFPEGLVPVYVGDPNSETGSQIPMNYYWEAYMSQIIYPFEEVLAYGEIHQISFDIAVANALPSQQPIQIYLGTTDQESFATTTSWVPLSNFELVFSGVLPVEGLGIQEVSIPLTTPFEYGSGNLVLMMNKPYQSQYAQNNLFRVTPTTTNQIMFAYSMTADINITTPPAANGRAMHIMNLGLVMSTDGYGAITGTVTEIDGITPIEGVEISIDGTSRRTVTDADGEYTIAFLTPGLYNLTASKLMYITATFEDIEVYENDTTTFDFSLEVPSYNLAAVSISGPTSPSAGFEQIYTVVVRNDGSDPADGYMVKLMQVVADDDDIELASAAGVLIDSAESVNIRIVWTPATDGSFQIYGLVDYSDDSDPTDDATGLLNVTVQPAGIGIAYVGNPASTTTSNAYPISYYYKSSVTQTIYLASEIGTAGEISKIVYRFTAPTGTPGSNGTIPEGIPVKFYMAMTNETALTSFIPYAQFTEVYSGELAVTTPGTYNVEIELDTPFNYTGGNLVIMGYRPFDPMNPNPETGSPGWYYNSAHQWQYTVSTANRTRYSNSDTYPPTFSAENLPAGTGVANIPNISIHMTVSGIGTLAGTVTHSSTGLPMEGVLVAIDGTNFQTITGEDGYYQINNVPEGTIAITASKHGYEDYTDDTIVIEEGLVTEVSFTMTPETTVAVTGRLILSDTGDPAEGAELALTGYENYTATSTATGHFTFPEVYANHIYTLTVRYTGYQTYTDDDIEVLAVDLNLGDITLEEIAFRPSNVVATETGDDMTITWGAPRAIWGIDDYITWTTSDEVVGRIGYAADSGEDMTGAHRFTPADLAASGVETGMSITQVAIGFGTDLSDMTTLELKIWQGGTSIVDAGTLLYTQPIIGWASFPENAYTTIELTEPFVIDASQELRIGYRMVNTRGYPMGRDGGPGVPGKGDLLYCATLSPDWRSYCTAYPWNHNFAIKTLIGNEPTRAIVLSQSDDTTNPFAISALTSPSVDTSTAVISDISNIIPRRNPDSVVTPQSNIRNTRVLVDYNVYRTLIENIGDETQWTGIATNVTDTTYVDNTWDAVDPGVYVYAVKAVYTNNVLSAPAFSNNVASGMEAPATVIVATSDESSVIGAIITLENNNEDYTYTHTITSGSSYTFPAVWLGTYTVTVALEGYTTTVEDDFEVTATGVNEIAILLIERAMKPINVVAVRNPEGVELTWMAPGAAGNQEFWFSYTDAEYGENYGYGGDETIAYRFDQQKIAEYGLTAGTLTKVAIYTYGVYTGDAIIIKVWTGGSANPYYEGQLVHEQRVTALVDDGWTEVELTTPVAIPTNGEIWFGASADADDWDIMDVDAGPTTADGYSNLICWPNYGEPWTTTGEMGYEENFMIRGYVVDALGRSRHIGYAGTGDILPNRENRIPRTRGNRIATTRSASEALSERASRPERENRPSTRIQRAASPYIDVVNVNTTTSQNTRNSRVLTGFNIYRTTVENMDNESLWTGIAQDVTDTTYVDNTWSSVTNGAYVYAVKSVYTNNILSDPAFSNVLGVGMEAEVSISVFSPNLDPVPGAVIRLVDNADQTRIYVGTITEGFTYVFDAVWHGTYTLTVSATGFATYTDDAFPVAGEEVAEDVMLEWRTVVYSEGFENTADYELPLGWTKVGAQGTYGGWVTVTDLADDLNINTAVNNAIPFDDRMVARSWEDAGTDQWLFSSGIQMNAAQEYTISFYFVAPGWPSYGEFDDFEVKIGTTPTATAMGSAPIIFSNLSTIVTAWRQVEVPFTPTETGTYYIAFHDLTPNGEGFFITIDNLEITSNVTSEEDNTLIPVASALMANYPNPFNPSTTISFDNAREGNVRIDVYNIKGQKVTTLTNENFGVGRHKVVWNGTDDNGRGVASGVYFYRMQTENFTQTKKMILMK